MQEKTASAIEQLKSWLEEGDAGGRIINYDTDIIEQRIIDSLRFVALLMLVEELRGEEVDERDVDIEKFRTLNSINNYFF
jgi:acyl carrier protein